jgi:CHAT domain
VLHDGHRPLATGIDLLFSRYQQTDKRLSVPDLPGSPAQQPQLLRILMAIAAPGDRDSLKLHQEAEDLKRELRGRSDQGSLWDIDLTILEHPDRAELAQALEQGQYQVFHYAGHSNLGVDGGMIDLVNRRSGLTESLTGNELAGLLANNGIQIAVFNSCRGAYTDSREMLADTGGERNLAEALVKQGIPAVLAMAERIPDEVALNLTQLFYRNLKQGNSVDLSLNRARQGLMFTYGSKQLYWALPILYLHSKFEGYPVGRSIDRGLTSDELVSRTPGFGAIEPMSFDEEMVEGLLDEIEYPDTLDDDDVAFDLEVRQTLDLVQPRTFPQTLSQAPSAQESSPPLPPVAVTTPQPSIPDASVPKSSHPQITPQTPRRWTGRSLAKTWLLPGSLVVVAVVSLGVLFSRAVQNRSSEPNILPPVSSGNSQAIDPKTLSKTSTSEVTAMAIDRFSRGDLEAGSMAVEALLDRGALQQAKAALEAVSQTVETHANIEFLHGRLAWQFAQKNDPDYRTSTDDARRYWESAQKQQPDSWRYREALGFAYYEENQLDLAYQTWQRALQLTATDAETANVRAGLALVLMKKAAQTRSLASATQLQHQAIVQRQNVLTTAPVSFSSPNALAPNWLWTETAIRDWQTLLQLPANR